MHKQIIKFLLLGLCLCGVSSHVLAKEHGFVMSIPNEIVQKQLYRVNIQRINGVNPMVSTAYYVEAGVTTVRVSLLLNPEWAPKLTIAADNIYSKEIQFTVENGKTYQIGGKVNPEASDEAQRDGSFWDPVIFKVQE